jgi:diguanylate cyclase (GGDEF)-like protein
MKTTNYISNKQLIIRIVFGFLLISIVILLLSTVYIKNIALNNLAQDDAKKTSELIFETMNTRMQEGWGKEDLNKILSRLEYVRKGLKVSSYRSHKVEEILGVVPSNKQIVEKDPIIQKAMKGKEQFIIEKDGSIRFIYPMKVTQECITCHYNTKVGDINGVLDIKYPPSDIKISLDMMTYYFLLFFIIFIIVFFYIFFFVINKKMVTPIIDFTKEIQRISDANDLTLRADVNTTIDEIGTLQNAFNKLLETTKYYYDKLINNLYIDSLTDLDNFIKLQKDLEQSKNFSLVLVDIDKFKQLNNFYGTNVADFILKHLAILLKESTDENTKVYRVNADKFALLYPMQINIDDLQNLLNTINKHKFQYKFTDINIRVHIGFIVNDPNRSLEKVELALELAKKQRVNIVKYDDSFNLEDEYMQHMVWINKIEEALQNDNIIPYFQPMKSPKENKIVKYETLMRLQDIDMVYTPDYFIEISQNANLYAQLTQRLIEKTFKYFTNLDTNIKFSLNFALEDITNRSTINLLFKLLEEYKYSSSVVIELLETQEISDYESLNKFINQVKSYGAKVAIDDFGSGYSNFNYILNLNIDIIKLDSSLVENLDNDENSLKVVKSIIKVVHSLDLEVVAEKVHSQAIEDILTDLKVDYLQGYHIGKPQSEILPM